MVVGVDEHGGGCGPRGEEEAPRGPLAGDYLAVAFVMSDVPVSTFFGTVLPVHGGVERRDPERADLVRVLRDRRALAAGLHCLDLVGQPVEADEDDAAAT